MNYLRLLSPRIVVLFLLWSVPLIVYIAIGLIAIYQAGWLRVIAWTLPPIWLTTWIVSKYWKAPPFRETASLEPVSVPDFWTPQDAAALKLVEEFRNQLAEIDQVSIADPNRYIQDAQALSHWLAKHYHQDSNKHAFSPLTIVEILSVIHLSVEELEAWILENVPGSDLITVGHLEQVPSAIKALDFVQSMFFVASAIVNPTKLLAYPIWRKSGRVTVELQNGLISAIYQVYLRQVSYYLIEMYSGRLQGGSQRYRQQFGHLAAAVHRSSGDTKTLSDLDDVSTAIAVMGQVKAGKSSLINALMKEKVAAISVLPETREVKRYDYKLLESDNAITLLDTPGYSEANVSKHQLSEIKTAAQAADIILLVMAANSPARNADVEVVRELKAFYRDRPNLRPPPIIAVLTHIDLLRPVREWSPPYNWRKPVTTKEHSISKAVEYAQELFGDSIAAYVCVYAGEAHTADSSIAEELVPRLIEHLSHGHSAAVLKAFYNQISRERFQQLSKQVIGLLKNIGRKLAE